MGKPYSQDLRNRIIDYINQGYSARAAGRIFAVSASTAVRLASAYQRSGDTRAKPQGRAPGTVGKLSGHIRFLLEVVRSDPDITLAELAGALEEAEGVRANVSSIHRALVRAGWSYKKRPDRQRA
jgi:transposase